MKKYHTLDFNKVLDVIAFRIVARSIPDCYNALGVIHANYNPLINKIKDYIAIPKGNNYQSLHTTILGMYPFPVEIQIRTKQMNDIAEFGVAAHYAYKNDTDPNASLTQRQAQWLRQLQDSVTQYHTEDKKLQDRLSIELLDTNIFVYTPKGEVIELPQGSTVLDFAFRVHTDVGLRFNNATVNGVIKPIGHRLQSGDVVSINTFKNRYTATKYWFDYLHMPSAKSKLMRFLRQQEKDIYLNKGIESLTTKLQKYNLPSLNNEKDKIKKHYGNQYEHMLMQIASKTITPWSVIKEVYALTSEKPQLPSLETKKNPPASSIVMRVVVDDQPLLQYDLCPLCHPQASDKIIARTGKDGIKIHTMSCKALQTVSYDKLIRAYRYADNGLLSSHLKKKSDMSDVLYHFGLSLVIPHQGSNIIALMTIFQELGVQIDSVKINKSSVTNQYTIVLDSLYENPSKIAYIIRYLHKHCPYIISMKKEIR